MSPALLMSFASALVPVGRGQILHRSGGIHDERVQGSARGGLRHPTVTPLSLMDLAILSRLELPSVPRSIIWPAALVRNACAKRARRDTALTDDLSGFVDVARAAEVSQRAKILHDTCALMRNA